MTIRKTNLLFVFTDEQSISTMRSYGNAIINTPNMDKLADQSVVFEHAYVTQPVCTPSRASLLTGLYPHVHGCIANNIPLDMELPCLPEMGDFSDYRTGYFGKWHLGDEVFPQHGFRKWVSYEDSYRMGYSNGRDQKIHSSYHHYLVEQGFKPDKIAKDGFEFFSRDYCARLPEEHGKPAYTAREVTRFIRENEDNPFIAYVNFLEPHMPYFGPRDEQYDPDKVVLPANFGHMLSEEHPLKTRLFHQAYLEYGHSGLSLQTEDDWRKMIAHYWGLVSLVDTHLGVILQTLEDCGLADRTIVVFTSDHGDMMGSHRLLAKCVMFEEAIKVPLLLKVPGLKPARIREPVSQIDLVPTLLEALGQHTSAPLQGESLLPFLQGQAARVRDHVFVEWNGSECGLEGHLQKGFMLPCWNHMATEEQAERAIGAKVRTVITPDMWKYNFSSIGEDELYNLNDDPAETCNLIGDAAYQMRVFQMREKIKEWQRQTGDPLFD
ncbi:sulfatase-like hydrolase/transferase [Paenibacillus thalictri]|uniref:sulfatase-like hydrolase/transferase n=1 Tax=Paenibacillus thalictri TaxID=2527873 RepID=UPI0013EEF562|nr:sulfatase-like hydrolase/transferase [Paenibacillus thalictri]